MTSVTSCQLSIFVALNSSILLYYNRLDYITTPSDNRSLVLRLWIVWGEIFLCSSVVFDYVRYDVCTVWCMTKLTFRRCLTTCKWQLAWFFYLYRSARIKVLCMNEKDTGYHGHVMGTKYRGVDARGVCVGTSCLGKLVESPNQRKD